MSNALKILEEAERALGRIADGSSDDDAPASLTPTEAAAIRGLLEWLRAVEKSAPCPCLHTTPCDPSCTCLHPASSRGCRRCCTYGSKDQKETRARHLAAAIDAAPRDAAYAMPSPLGWGVWRVGEGFVTMRSRETLLGMTLDKAREVAVKLNGKPPYEVRPIPAQCSERHTWTDVACRTCGLGVPHAPKV